MERSVGGVQRQFAQQEPQSTEGSRVLDQTNGHDHLEEASGVYRLIISKSLIQFVSNLQHKRTHR